MSSYVERLASLGICFLFLMASFGLSPTQTQNQMETLNSPSYSAIPSADPDDGRFLGIAGSNIETFTKAVLVFIGVKAGETSFKIGVFDGDGGNNWDSDGDAVTIYRLYKDPLKTGTKALYLTNWTSDDCFNDDWYTRKFMTDSSARAPSGNYFYRLEIDWRDGIPDTDVNLFKIRTTGQISLMAGRWFGFHGAPQRVMYVDDNPDPCPFGVDPNPGDQNDPDINSYNGKWCFSFYVPRATNRVEFWDGDSDNADDTDDPNTPPTYPANEGVNPGQPPDSGTLYYCCDIEPNIYNLVEDPDGNIYTNYNPSGNREEEMFSIGNLADDDYVIDYTLSPGLWKYKVRAMDSHNMNFLKTTYEVFMCGDDPPLPVNPPPEVEPDHTLDVNASGTYFFNHTVKNRGSTQAFDLKAESSHNWDVHIYQDSDQDGAYDPGEPEVSQTGPLAENEVFYLTLSVDVPTGQNGVTDNTTITASSQIEWAIQDSAQDTIIVATNQPPTSVAGGPYVEFEGSPVGLDGSASSDPDGDALEYRWDLDGDGTWDTGYSSSPFYNHTWLDNWAGIVRLEVTDGEFSDVDSANVTVYNVAPTPEWTSRSADGTILNPPYPEGKEILFEATVYDPGIYDTFTYDWDFGDGTILLDAGPSVYHTYGDNDTYIVVLTVTDDDGGVGIDDTPPLLTTNEDPVVLVNMPYCIFVEGTYPCEPIGEFTDPGWLDTHSGVWDYGDGTYDTADITEENNPPDATGWNITSHVYGDNGVYNISFTVFDDDGGWGSDWADAYVQNLPPSFTLNAPASVNEGDAFVLGITATDPGSDDIIIDIDWGDGSSETMTYYNNGVGPDPPNSGEGVYPFTVYANLSHTYGDNGDFAVSITVSDDDGDSVDGSADIEVLNLPPQIALPMIPLIFNEGEEFSLSAMAEDPGSDDIEFTWNFELGPTFSKMYYNDGVAPDPPLSPWGTFPFFAQDSVNHTYGDNGAFNVTITAVDDDGGVATQQVIVTIVNVAPTIESVDYYLNASFLFRIAGEKWHNVEIHLYKDGTEVGYADITRHPGSPNDQMVAFGNVAVDLTSTYSAIAYYTPEDDPINGQIQGATPAWVIIQYQDGEERIHHTFNVNHEHTWTWEIEDFSPYFLGHNITFVATASDPGSDDLTFTWDWGDGSSESRMYYNDGIGPDPYPSPDVNPIAVMDEAGHAYTVSGSYTVVLTVMDDDGGSVTWSLTLNP